MGQNHFRDTKLILASKSLTGSMILKNHDVPIVLQIFDKMVHMGYQRSKVIP